MGEQYWHSVRKYTYFSAEYLWFAPNGSARIFAAHSIAYVIEAYLYDSAHCCPGNGLTARMYVVPFKKHQQESPSRANELNVQNLQRKLRWPVLFFLYWPWITVRCWRRFCVGAGRTTSWMLCTNNWFRSWLIANSYGRREVSHNSSSGTFCFLSRNPRYRITFRLVLLCMWYCYASVQPSTQKNKVPQSYVYFHRRNIYNQTWVSKNVCACVAWLMQHAVRRKWWCLPRFYVMLSLRSSSTRRFATLIESTIATHDNTPIVSVLSQCQGRTGPLITHESCLAEEPRPADAEDFEYYSSWLLSIILERCHVALMSAGKSCGFEQLSVSLQGSSSLGVCTACGRCVTVPWGGFVQHGSFCFIVWSNGLLGFFPSANTCFFCTGTIFVDLSANSERAKDNPTGHLHTHHQPRPFSAFSDDAAWRVQSLFVLHPSDRVRIFAGLSLRSKFEVLIHLTFKKQSGR